jgi:hypothetical protein
MTDADNCHCGRPAPGAVLCNDCGDTLRGNLHLIADRWAELEDALTWRDVLPGTIGVVNDGGTLNGERRLALSTGTIINERAVRARRQATDAVWFAVQVIRDDLDTAGRAFTPPPSSPNRSQDDTPRIARWIAAWHVSHITHRTDRESAEEIAGDVKKAEKAVYDATHPSGVHWAPVNLKCDQFATSDLGERVPCPGDMWALVGKDVMPELVCDHDESHTVAPGVWERSAWKRRAQPIHGITRLAERLAR